MKMCLLVVVVLLLLLCCCCIQRGWTTWTTAVADHGPHSARWTHSTCKSYVQSSCPQHVMTHDACDGHAMACSTSSHVLCVWRVVMTSYTALNVTTYLDDDNLYIDSIWYVCVCMHIVCVMCVRYSLLEFTSCFLAPIVY